jgi:hypothetical protein
MLSWAVRWHLWRTGHTLDRVRRVGHWTDTGYSTRATVIVCGCGREWVRGV